MSWDDHAARAVIGYNFHKLFCVENINGADETCIETTIDSGQTIKIKVSASAETKCVRCWHHSEDVGSNAEHPELCGRCVENVAGDGEQRLFA